MPTFSIRITNATFDTEGEFEHPDLESAKEQAFKGALQMGADEFLLSERGSLTRGSGPMMGVPSDRPQGSGAQRSVRAKALATPWKRGGSAGWGTVRRTAISLEPAGWRVGSGSHLSPYDVRGRKSLDLSVT